MNYIHNHQTILQGGMTAIFTASLLIRLAENPELFPPAIQDIKNLFINDDVDEAAVIGKCMATMSVEGSYKNAEQVYSKFHGFGDRYPHLFEVMIKDVELGFKVREMRNNQVNSESLINEFKKGFISNLKSVDKIVN